MTNKTAKRPNRPDTQYDSILGDIAGVIDAARSAAVRSVNAVMTAAYWLIGRRIVEFEQAGQPRAEYGTGLLKRLAADLTTRYGRGFSQRNLEQMRLFYQTRRISQTVSAESGLEPLQPSSPKPQTSSAVLSLSAAASRFPLPWSAYVRLLAVRNQNARSFYETEALRGGWSVRQLDRQINSQFYERTALSRDKAAMLAKGQRSLSEDRISPAEEIKDPYVLEFLGHEAVARYALDRLPNKVLAAEYRTTLPDETELAAEIERTRRILEQKRAIARSSGRTPDIARKLRRPKSGTKGKP
jgi:hypothetical protein